MDIEVCMTHVVGTFLEDATCVHLHAGRKEISPYTTYNYRYAEQEASVNAVMGVNAASEDVSNAQFVEGVEKVKPITSAKDKAQRRLEVKAGSTLMMGIPNEHQLKFNFVKDAKKLLEAVKKKFVLDQTFDRLQKLVSQLELFDEKLSQAEEGPNYALMAYSSSSSDSEVCKYDAVLPPYTGNFIPSTPDLSFTGLYEFVNEPVVENSKAMSSKEEPRVVRKNDDALIIEE
ncbi:hypothetical protein Tco_1508994 [Tanacetum coccineum]